MAIFPAGSGSDKASCSHYDVIGDWADTLPRLIYKDSTHTLLYDRFLVAFRALTLLVGGRKGIRPVKNGGWWSTSTAGALLGPDGVAPSRMVGVSASVNLPLHHKVQKFSSGSGWLGWSRKKGRKTVMVVAYGSLRLADWFKPAELNIHIVHADCIEVDRNYITKWPSCTLAAIRHSFCGWMWLCLYGTEADTT